MAKGNGNGSGESASEQSRVITDLSALKKCVTAVEKVHVKMERMKGEYMAACKAEREAIKGHYATARDKGLITRAVKELVKHRAALRTMQDDIAGLEGDIVDAYHEYAEACEEWDTTPLAVAAVTAAQARGVPA